MPSAGGAVPRACVAVLLIALAGCATDRQITEAEANGRAAMDAGHPSDAARDYRAALARARVKNDGEAIATAGTNLAIAELADNHPGLALTDARELQAELARRGRTPPETLGLVVATALYRQGDMAGAEQAASAVAAGHDPSVALRGRFLLGLIADARHDSTGVLAAALVLAGHHDKLSMADAMELKARLSLARGESAAAREAAEAAVKLRNELGDTRGVARCEALVAKAAHTADSKAPARSG